MKEDYPVQLIVRTLNVIFEIRDRHRFEYNVTHSRDAEGRTLEAQMSVIRYYYFTLFHSPIIFSPHFEDSTIFSMAMKIPYC